MKKYDPEHVDRLISHIKEKQVKSKMHSPAINISRDGLQTLVEALEALPLQDRPDPSQIALEGILEHDQP